MAKPELYPFPSSPSCETRPSSKRKAMSDQFSDSEIDAAEQLVQLSGDSSDLDTLSEANTASLRGSSSVTISTANSDPAIDARDHRFSGAKMKTKKFRPLSEIYSLTKPLSFANHRRR